MEMLIKIAIGTISFFASVCIMFFSWVGLSIIDVKTELAVTHEKVSSTNEKVANIDERVKANYDMIRPMWQEFLMEKNVANITLADVPTDKQSGEQEDVK